MAGKNIDIQNIYNEGELPLEATVKEYLTVQKEGDRQVSRTMDFYKYALIKWKQVFLKEISEKYKGKTLDFITPRATQKYRLVGVPFYNNTDENQFKQSLYEAIEN